MRGIDWLRTYYLLENYVPRNCFCSTQNRRCTVGTTQITIYIWVPQSNGHLQFICRLNGWTLWRIFQIAVAHSHAEHKRLNATVGSLNLSFYSAMHR